MDRAYQRLCDTRPYSSDQYDREFFDPEGTQGTDGALVLAYGINDRDRSIALENTGIAFSKEHGFGVNAKTKDSHNNNYDPTDPGIVYAVPVKASIETVEAFNKVHVVVGQSALKKLKIENSTWLA